MNLRSTYTHIKIGIFSHNDRYTHHKKPNRLVLHLIALSSFNPAFRYWIPTSNFIAMDWTDTLLSQFILFVHSSFSFLACLHNKLVGFASLLARPSERQWRNSITTTQNSKNQSGGFWLVYSQSSSTHILPGGTYCELVYPLEHLRVIMISSHLRKSSPSLNGKTFLPFPPTGLSSAILFSGLPLHWITLVPFVALRLPCIFDHRSYLPRAAFALQE